MCTCKPLTAPTCPAGWLSSCPARWTWRTFPWTSRPARCSWRVVSSAFCSFRGFCVDAGLNARVCLSAASRLHHEWLGLRVAGERGGAGVWRTHPASVHHEGWEGAGLLHQTLQHWWEETRGYSLAWEVLLLLHILCGYELNDNNNMWHVHVKQLWSVWIMRVSSKFWLCFWLYL